MCLIAEIIHTCSHEKVAHAAVASLGPDFAGKVGATAGAFGLSIGAFTARTVREFGQNVGEQEKRALQAIMERADQPILTGLQHILLPVVEGDGTASYLEAFSQANTRKGGGERRSPRASRNATKPVNSPN